MWQYRKVSSEIRSQVSSETSPKTACTESIIAGRITRKACFNVYHGTREANVVEGQPDHALSLPQLQITRGSQQPVQCNRNTERRQRRRARRQQDQEAGTTVCLTDTECKAYTWLPFELHRTREVCVWRPKIESQEACIFKHDAQQREVRVSWLETHHHPSLNQDQIWLWLNRHLCRIGSITLEPHFQLASNFHRLVNTFWTQVSVHQHTL